MSGRIEGAVQDDEPSQRTKRETAERGSSNVSVASPKSHGSSKMRSPTVKNGKGKWNVQVLCCVIN